MTEQVITTNRLHSQESSHAIALGIARACSIAFLFMSVWCAFHLLGWAMAKRELATPSTNAVTMEVRERQLGCLTKNIYYESAGEPFEGKVAVAQVTLNRAEAGGFPEDICRVIYQKNIVYQKVLCQFSWVCETGGGSKPTNSKEWAESQAVARKVLLEGFRLPSLKDALYFHGDYINPGWRRERVAHIGRHIFYR
jgi:spore germination cell wall hydrolase CwlJ-like protein